jgi:hypothetical protein
MFLKSSVSTSGLSLYSKELATPDLYNFILLCQTYHLETLAYTGKTPYFYVDFPGDIKMNDNF